MENLKNTLDSYQALEIQNPEVIEHMELLRNHIQLNERLMEIMDGESDTIYQVTVEQPYTNCCDVGPFDKEIHMFTTRKTAEQFVKIQKKLGEKYVYCDTVEVLK